VLTPSTILLMTLIGGPVMVAAMPEGRAVAFLSQEVPRWSAEHKCYSCHNNGDAARALYTAKRLGRTIDDKVLADTTRWLSKPANWDHNGGDGEYNDKRLARLQFAASLSETKELGLVRDRDAFDKAAVWVAELQGKDGAWTIDTGGSAGAPATHGTALATFLARRTLQRLDERKYAKEIARADAWARKTSVEGVLDAAAVLLLLDRADDDDAVAQRRRCLELIRKGEAKDGGWGPYVKSPSEVFDTAVVVLALSRQKPTDEIRAMRKRGQKYLVAEQQADGSWNETTRPSGAVSYAERLSTTGWATLALLAE
jgi:squalene cyclase